MLRREPVTAHPRAAAAVLAFLSLIVAVPLLLSWAMGVVGLLLGGLAVSAVLTLLRLRRHPPGPQHLDSPPGP